MPQKNHGGCPMQYARKQYMDQLIKKKDNGRVKVITGLRRSGKSYLLFNLFHQYLLDSGIGDDQIVELALDEIDNAKYRNPFELNKAVKERVLDKQKRYYVFIDEIQFVTEIQNPYVDDPNEKLTFIDVVLGLMKLPNLDIYVTGSNSKMLSSDVLTQFRDRGDEIRVNPLSFAEVYENYRGDKRDAWRDYYTYGGLPAVAKMETPEEKEAYLKDLYRTIYLKDIIERNRLQNEEGLEEIFRVLASSMGTAVNPTKIANTFKSVANIKISSHTITKYIEYLKDAFLVSEALRYDVKGRKYIGSDSKFYFEDPGIRNAIIGFRQVEYGHMMENVLYNELCARGYSVDVGLVEVWEKNEEGNIVHKRVEVDYVINRGSQRIYVQSAYSMPDEEKRDQEQRPLIKINDSFRKIIISGEHKGKFYNDEGVLRIGVFDFLLDRDCLNE